VVSVAGYSGYLPLSESFSWLATLPAFLMLSVAAALEIAAYYIPGVDNLLDTVATPAALVAGTVVAAAVMADLPPLVKWTTAIIAGGGAAGITQAVTGLLRAKSTVTTGGLGNAVIATGELGGSLVTSLLALFLPLVALAFVVLFCWISVKLIRKLFRRAPNPADTAR
jgi:glucan phosphoethanolaminetransferase (alkaline phosphatase superfamily)